MHQQFAYSSTNSYQQIAGSRMAPYERGAVWYCTNTDEIIFWAGASWKFLANAGPRKWIQRLQVAAVAARMLPDFGRIVAPTSLMPGCIAPVVFQVLELLEDYGVDLVGVKSTWTDEETLYALIDSATDCSCCKAA